MSLPCRSALLAVVLTASLIPAADPTPEQVAFFESKVRPVLVEQCYSCHSAEAKKLKGGLRLDTAAGVRQGGESGPVIVPGEPEKSPLVKAVRHADGAPKMPPDKKLTAAEIADLAAWVKMGAPDPRTATAPAAKAIDLTAAREFWSFRPVRDPAPPKVKATDWPINDVDRFVLVKLEEKGLTPAAPADKRTLIRRATYDLTGLPPTPEEIDTFLKDDSSGAFAAVVDRLLESSAYGERWGRHWLDVVRYADTAGDNSDYPIPQMVRYRDWVIDAFNRDLPYDEFVRHQLAGDLLRTKDEADRQAKLIATGYLANAKRFGSYDDLGNGLPYPWYLTIEDTIDNLGRTFLGLTINCARCHDHKFDPLSAADYYALYGFFQSTRYPWPGIELDKVQRDLVPLVPQDKVAAVAKERQAKVEKLDAALKRYRDEKGKLDKLAPFSAAFAAVAKSRADHLGGRINTAKKDKEAVEKEPLPYPLAYAVADRPATGKRKVGNACVQIKGDPERLGPEVARRFPSVLGGQTLPSHEKGSGRRELAEWIVDPKNPLTARVMVNRLWLYHFGKAIVPTPSDFGAQGRPPTHPELLDFLAKRFVESGWSVKAMHRLLMRSRTYLMSSTEDEANAKLDVANDLLWRFNRRRLDAESIRDTLLAVSDGLDRTRGGPHPFPDSRKWDFTQHNPFKAVYDTNRRSVYLMTQRIQRHPFLALFDGADTNASTAKRDVSTTPLQALYLMNDPFVHARSKAFAVRVMNERSDDAGRVERAYALLYGRPPTADERSAAAAYLAKAGAKLTAGGAKPSEVAAKAWESLARALVLSNEFVYLD